MILDDIVFNKRQEVTALKLHLSNWPLPPLLKSLPKTRDFAKAVRRGRFSLITEIKRASPSAGIIRRELDPGALAKEYEECGAAAISVLTDEKYFQGKLEDLKAARNATTIPILRKDFIIDEAQIYQSRMLGADAVLLIVRILNDEALKAFIKLTEKLGMQALVEAHTAEEVKRALSAKAKFIGINNRDLDTLEVDLQNSLKLLATFPLLKKKIVIAESGITSREDLRSLKKAGMNGVLIGESLLKSGGLNAKIKELLS
jgi:indole-3-glycerol phosphate synthase